MSKINSKAKQTEVREELYKYLRDEMGYLDVTIEKEDSVNWLRVVIYNTNTTFINSTTISVFQRVFDEFRKENDYSDCEVDYYMETREEMDEYGTKYSVAVIEVDVMMAKK